MPASTLVSPEGELNTSLFESIAVEADESLTVIATLGAYGVSQSEFLDSVFETSFGSSRPREGVAAEFVPGDDSAVMTESPRNLVVLDVEGYDGPDLHREEDRERASNFAVSLADVLLFIVRMKDLPRVESNGMSALRSSITEALVLQNDGTIPSPSGKRAFIFVVTEFESDVLGREELISGVLQEMQTVYNSVAKPPRSPPRVTEVFEFEFITLPDQKLFKDDYDQAVRALQSKLLDPASDDYFFESSVYARDINVSLASTAEATWKALEAEQTQDMPPTEDLTSTFDCGNAMRNVYEKYQRSVRMWRRETDEGAIIENFGTAANEMVEKTISVYDEDAAIHKRSKAFKRKRYELQELIDADLYGMFVIQIAKLREVTYRLFKDKLNSIEDSTTGLEKKINTALKESQTHFHRNAEALRPAFASWRFDNDSKELASQMREDSTERLQRVRLVDYQERGGRRRRRPGAGGAPGSKPRQPINVGFHYLDPAPFGWKDSRYEKLSVNDNLEFNSGALTAGPGTSGGNASGLSVPLMPSRNSGWKNRNQDFIYTERK